MMAQYTSSQHITTQQLRSFLLNKLSRKQVKTVAEHLAVCNRCIEAMHQLWEDVSIREAEGVVPLSKQTAARVQRNLLQQISRL